MSELIKSAIDCHPNPDVARIQQCIDEIEAVIAKYGQHGTIAAQYLYTSWSIDVEESERTNAGA